MGSYDRINQLKAKYEAQLKEKEEKIAELQKKNEELEDKNRTLRQEMHNAGLGKSKVHQLKSELVAKEREYKTVKNKLRELDGSKLISTFSSERQELIAKIRKLKFDNNNIFNALAFKFKDGLDNIIQLAYRIENKMDNDMDYFTFVFRDDIVGLLEKMLRVVLKTSEDSASKYLVKINNGDLSFPKEYYSSIPSLKDKKTIENVLKLINLESSGYHGTKSSRRKLQKDHETDELVMPDAFLNLTNEEQLEAIFTLLKFMYFVFTNKDNEVNLLSISQYWFTTI